MERQPGRPFQVADIPDADLIGLARLAQTSYLLVFPLSLTVNMHSSLLSSKSRLGAKLW